MKGVIKMAEQIVLQDQNGNYQYFDEDGFFEQLLNSRALIVGMDMKTLLEIRKEFLNLACEMPINIKVVKEVFANIKGRRQTLSDAIELLDKVNNSDWLEHGDEAEMFVQDNDKYIIDGCNEVEGDDGFDTENLGNNHPGGK